MLRPHGKKHIRFNAVRCDYSNSRKAFVQRRGEWCLMAEDVLFRKDKGQLGFLTCKLWFRLSHELTQTPIEVYSGNGDAIEQVDGK